MKIDPSWIGLGALGIVAAVVLYNSQDGNRFPVNANERVVTTPDRTRACRPLTGEPADRLAACFAQLTSVRPSDAANAQINALTTGASERRAVYVVGAELQIDADQIQFQDDKVLVGLGLGTDEQALAKALRDRGARVLVVHRDITGALDRDSRVLSRLAQHDFLEYHQLRYVTDELMIYTVRDSPSKVPLATGDLLVKGLRARLAGKRQEAPRQQWNPDAVRLIASIRLQGLTLATRHSVGKNIERTLDELSAKLIKRWQREVAIYGHGNLWDRLDETRIDVHIVMERAIVEPRSRFAIFDLWEMGVDGMMFRQRPGAKDEKFTYMPGSELMTHSWKSADKFLREATKQGGWKDERPWEKDPRTRLDLIRTQHFIEDRPGGGGNTIRLVRGLPETTMEDMTDDELRQMLVDGGEWWLRNMREDGSINYKFWPTQNRMSTEYNEVRHILAARDLADTYRYRADPRYTEGAKETMDWLMKFKVEDTDPTHATLLHPPDDSLLFRYNNNQKLGTVAVALLGWVEYAKATGDHSEDENIRKMANFVLSQSLPNGKFHAYYVPDSHPYNGQVNDIVPGEAALALGEVAEYFGENEPWLGFFERYLDYYEPWFRKRAAKRRDYGRWPENHYSNEDRLELVQFGPWSVMAARQYYERTGDERAAKFGLEVADWIIDQYQWRGDRSPWPDFVGGYYKMPTELPAMQTFCYSEGTAAAYRIAAKYDPENKDKYDRSTLEALRFMRAMMYDDENSYFIAEDELMHGGIKYTMNENKVRIDYVGHGLSTISQYLDAKDFDPAKQLQLSPLDLEGPPNPNRILSRAEEAAARLEAIENAPESVKQGAEVEAAVP